MKFHIHKLLFKMILPTFKFFCIYSSACAASVNSNYLSIMGANLPDSNPGKQSLSMSSIKFFLYSSVLFLRVDVNIEALFEMSFIMFASWIFTPPMVPKITHLASMPRHSKLQLKKEAHTGSRMTSTPS